MTLQIKDYILSVAKDEVGNTSYILLDKDTNELVLQTTRYSDVVGCVK